jgi:hypothetical protein
MIPTMGNLALMLMPIRMRNLGIELGINLGTELGTKLGIKLGINLGTKLGTKREVEPAKILLMTKRTAARGRMKNRKMMWMRRWWSRKRVIQPPPPPSLPPPNVAALSSLPRRVQVQIVLHPPLSRFILMLMPILSLPFMPITSPLPHTTMPMPMQLLMRPPMRPTTCLMSGRRGTLLCNMNTNNNISFSSNS